MGVGQSHGVKQAMLVILDEDDRVRVWGVQNGRANWEYTGLSSAGLSTSRLVIEGEFKRRVMPLGMDPSQARELLDGQ